VYTTHGPPESWVQHEAGLRPLRSKEQHNNTTKGGVAVVVLVVVVLYDVLISS
jgi:hypothetical protein